MLTVIFSALIALTSFVSPAPVAVEAVTLAAPKCPGNQAISYALQLKRQGITGNKTYSFTLTENEDGEILQITGSEGTSWMRSTANATQWHPSSQLSAKQMENILQEIARYHDFILLVMRASLPPCAEAKTATFAVDEAPASGWVPVGK